MKIAGYEIHPACLAMPEMPSDEYKTLKGDIKENGQLCPIELFENKVIDGRHRLRACKELKLEPWTADTDCNGQTPTSYVVSLNFSRRHLTPSQKAAIAAELLPEFEAEAKKRQKAAGGDKSKALPQKVAEAPKGEAREQAAAAVGVNKQYVSDAAKLKEKDPKAFDEVKRGEKTIAEAKREAKSGKDGTSATETAQEKSPGGRGASGSTDAPGDLAKKNKTLAHAHRDKLARAICDYHEVCPNRKERDRLVKLVQGIELW